LRENVYKTLITDLDDANDEWVAQWRRDPAWSTPISVAVSVHPDQWWVFWTHSFAIFPTLSNQLDSNLANWMPQSRCNKFWSFFLQQLNGSTCAM